MEREPPTSGNTRAAFSRRETAIVEKRNQAAAYERIVYD